MTRLLIALGLLGNGVLIAFLIALSGFVFGGPEGMRGDPTAVSLWSAALLAILASSIAALVLARRGRRDVGAVVAMAPTIAALFAGLASL